MIMSSVKSSRDIRKKEGGPDKDTILKTFFFAAPTSRGYNYNALPNFTKSQWHRGVPSEVNYRQMFPFPSLKSKYVVITNFFIKSVPYFSNNLTKADWKPSRIFGIEKV